MPTTLIGLLIFVILLTPGFCFALRRERGRHPYRTQSAFREIAELLLAGLAVDFSILLLFAVLRILLPEHTPDVGKLIRTGKTYFSTHYESIVAWVAILWVLACLVAYVAAAIEWTEIRPARFALKRFPKLKKLMETEKGRRPVSAWWKAFEAGGGDQVTRRVLCRLEDGTRIEGTSWSYNPGVNEVDDRSFTLVGPITVAEPDSPPMHTNLGTVVVSARRLQYLYVRYVPKPPQDEALDDSGAPGPEAQTDPSHVREVHRGQPTSWVAVSIIITGFIVGGIAMVVGPVWWLFWTGAGIVVIGGIFAWFGRIVDDWY